MSLAKALHSKEWAEGYAAAVADLVRRFDQPTLAAGLLSGHGFRLSDFDDFYDDDRRVIAELYKSERQLRTGERLHLSAERKVSNQFAKK